MTNLWCVVGFVNADGYKLGSGRYFAAMNTPSIADRRRSNFSMVVVGEVVGGEYRGKKIARLFKRLFVPL